MAYRILPAVSIPKRVATLTTPATAADTLYRYAKRELSDKSFPQMECVFSAIDLSRISLRKDQKLTLGDSVFVLDESVGLANYVRLTKVSYSLEKPFDLDLEFVNRQKSLSEILQSVPQGNQILPDTDDAEPGQFVGIDSDGNYGLIDVPETHTHTNLSTLEAIQDIAEGTEGQVPTLRSGSIVWDDTAATHSHAHFATLEAIPDMSTATVDTVLQKTASGLAFNTLPASHTHANKTTLDAIAALSSGDVGKVMTAVSASSATWQLNDNQQVVLGEVLTVSAASGDPQSYSVRVLSSVDKSTTSETLSSCFVPDDLADPLTTGQLVAVVKQSAAGIAAGKKHIIIGCKSPDREAPAHSHTTDRWGFNATWTG
jgi:hypothetical protein